MVEAVANVSAEKHKPLAGAIIFRDMPLVELLISKGAKIQTENEKDRETYLHVLPHLAVVGLQNDEVKANSRPALLLVKYFVEVHGPDPEYRA